MPDAQIEQVGHNTLARLDLPKNDFRLRHAMRVVTGEIPAMVDRSLDGPIKRVALAEVRRRYGAAWAFAAACVALVIAAALTAKGGL